MSVFPIKSESAFFLYLILASSLASVFAKTWDRETLDTHCLDLRNNDTARVVAHYGWPFSLNCGVLIQRWNATFGSEFPPQNSQCFVKDPRTNTLNSSNNLVLQSNSPALSEFQLYQTSGDDCLSAKVNVSLVPLPSASCVDAVKEAASCDHKVQHRSYVEGETMRLPCRPAPGSDGIEPPSLPATLVWRFTKRHKNGSAVDDHTCRTLEDSFALNRFSTEADPGFPEKLRIDDVNLFNPGIYTCEVTYGGQTAYVAHYSVCVQDAPEEHFVPKVTCEKETSFFVGDVKTVTCKTRKNAEKLQPGDLQVKWRKEGSDNVLCEVDLLTTNRTAAEDKRIACGLKNFVNDAGVCYSYVPEEDEVTDDIKNNIFQLFFTISNIAKGDADFSVEMVYKGVESKRESFKFVFNPLRELRRIALVLGVVLALVLVLAFAVYTGWHYRSIILLFYRRHFGKYDNNRRPYAAILAYEYRSNMPEKARIATTEIVSSIKNKLNQLHYPYCDPIEDFEQGNIVDVLLQHMHQSHRMIVVLTDEYVQAPFARFVAEQGVFNMRTDKMKVIFVRAPGVGDALRRNSDSPHMDQLQEALKVCRTVHWRNNASRRFMADIELAMPKLRAINPPECQVAV